MPVATYTTDLIDISTSETTTNWTEPTGATAGGTASQENEYFIQGNFCNSKTFNATGLGGLHYNNGAGVTIPVDGAVYTWIYWTSPNSLATKSNGGYRITIGSAAGNYQNFFVAGSDTVQYGGWNCYPIDPRQPSSANTGTPTGTYQFFGWVANNQLSISRGNPFGVDAVRYGRGLISITGGDSTNGYANFANTAANNDLQLNRWGIFQGQPSGFLMQGELQFGTTTSAVDFRDENKFITLAPVEFVSSGFNSFEVQNTSSNVEWTGINVLSLSKQARGTFLAANDATITITDCGFTDMGTFEFKSKTTVSDTVFLRCQTVTQNTSTITNCIFDSPNTSPALLAAQPEDLIKVTGSSFISSGTGHGIEFRGTAANTTLSGVIFTGYAASDGSTGNEAVYANIASGNMTISITNGGTTPSIRTAGATVTVVNAVTFTVTNIAANTEIRLFRQSDMVQLAGAEDVGNTTPSAVNLVISTDPDNPGRYTAQYDYNFVANTPIYVVAHSLDFQWLRTSATLRSTPSSLKIAQLTDRQYQNP